ISTAEDLTLVNRRGDVLFTSAITGTGVTSVSNTGLWMKPVGGPLRKIIREGDQAAGLAPGINYRGTIGLLSFNNAGQSAFLTGLTDGVSSNVGSYAHYLVDADGTARMLARSGTQAPGTSAGVTYDFSITTRTILSDSGQVAFGSYLLGPGTDSTNNYAIWAGRPGDMRLVARLGDTIDVDPGVGVDNRTITYLSLWDAPWGANGQLAWFALFSDNTQMILMTPVPEPTGILAGLAFAAFTLRRFAPCRRRQPA
ncbi:MAG: DUF7453 family protein, partial [Gemmataceae bacterium]